MIGGLLLVLLAVSGVMRAPLWGVPAIALMIAVISSTAPPLRRSISRPVEWAAIALASAAAYGIGYGLGLALIG